tara:strand:- start:9794 stop:10444 length:651 start_codon:yes stop_codon:yes gene_type:complete
MVATRVFEEDFSVDFTQRPDGAVGISDNGQPIFQVGSLGVVSSGGMVAADGQAAYNFFERRRNIERVYFDYSFETGSDPSKGSATIIATKGGRSNVNQDVIGTGGGTDDPTADGSIHLVWTATNMLVQYWQGGFNPVQIHSISQSLTAGTRYQGGFRITNGELFVLSRASTGGLLETKITQTGIATLLAKNGRFGCFEVNRPAGSNAFKFYRVNGR